MAYARLLVPRSTEDPYLEHPNNSPALLPDAPIQDEHQFSDSTLVTDKLNACYEVETDVDAQGTERSVYYLRTRKEVITFYLIRRSKT